MVQLTKEQRVFIVLHYTQTANTAAVQNAFRARFPDRNLPHKTTILRNFEKYSIEGTTSNLNKGNSGRRRTARSEEIVAAVRALLEQNPRNVSARRNPIEITSASFNRITRLDPPSLSNACTTRIIGNGLAAQVTIRRMVHSTMSATRKIFAKHHNRRRGSIFT